MPTASIDEGSGRADRLLRQAAPDLPRALMKSLFLSGRVRANGRRVKASQALDAPVTFDWELPESAEPSASSELWDEVTVLHDAGGWFALNKPSGLHSVRLKDRGGDSLEDWLAANEPGTEKLPEHGLVNRLDQETSGVVLVARDAKIRDHLRDSIASAEKIYWTAVIGEPPDSGSIDFELRAASRASGTVTRFGRRAQRTGETRYRVIGRKPGFSLLEVQLAGPGARHQIRAHLSGEGFPVAGDRLYKGDFPDAPSRLALHAWKLTLSGEKEPVIAPVPRELLDWWES